MIEGLAESISSLLKLFAGYLSDRLGKRKLLVVAGYCTRIDRPAAARHLREPGTQVLAIRLTDRVGKGIRTAPRDAMIADTVTIEQRGIAFGFHRAMDHGGAVIGPLLGYLLVVLFVANSRSPTSERVFQNLPGCFRSGVDGGARRDLFHARIAGTETRQGAEIAKALVAWIR